MLREMFKQIVSFFSSSLDFHPLFESFHGGDRESSNLFKIREGHIATVDLSISIDMISKLGRILRYSTLFGSIVEGTTDPIFGLSKLYEKDEFAQKVNLGVGVFKTEEGETFTPACVWEAENRIVENRYSKVYSPEDGLSMLQDLSQKLIFGEESDIVNSGRIASLQTLSGTGAIYVATDFIHNYLPGTTIYYPDPTWINHNNIFEKVGVPHKPYDYLKETAEGCFMDWSFDHIPPQSVVLLHPCCHNPTGVDPTFEDWGYLCDLVLEHELIPFFDSAYLGLSSGNVDEDCEVLKMFVENGVENMIITQSYAKNMGLYGERAGCLHLICSTQKVAENLKLHLNSAIRTMYTSPPIHGGQIVVEVLSDPDLKKRWLEDVKAMQKRASSLRSQLVDLLVENGSTRSWDHVLQQNGLFSYTCLKEKEVDRLINEFHIYMTPRGRISITGLNQSNIEYVAKAFVECTEN